jgi:DNA-directed RNA polymerase subunit M
VEFCPKCGSTLVVEKAEDRIVLACRKCGYSKEPEERTVILARRIEHSPREQIVVIKEEEQLRTLPTAKIECPRCGNNLAYFWQVQTRSADESATSFYKCTKCGYTFREYG